VIGLVVIPNEVGVPNPTVVDDCQSMIFPNWLFSVISVDDPVQIGFALAEGVPPVTALTVMLTEFEKEVEHVAPLVIMAL
jgi:hypothetical protein